MSSFLLRDFEPSAVRLKRKLRLILSKNVRHDKLGEKNVTLTEFTFYLVFLVTVTMICTINRTSQDIFNADRCLRRLLVDQLALGSVKTIEQFWSYLQRFNQELYRNVVTWREVSNTSTVDENHQILLLDENFILGLPRLRQLRVNHTHCRVFNDSATCYASYKKSREDQNDIVSPVGRQYPYTFAAATAALTLSNIDGPYGTGGFVYSFHPTESLNAAGLLDLKTDHWLDLSTRAIVIELLYFNPNDELVTSISILFEFLTTGTIEVKEFFHTISLNGYFFGRKKILGLFEVLSLLGYVLFGFHYVGKIAEHRLWFIMSSFWNFYDLGLLVLFTVTLYFDIVFLMNVSYMEKCLSQIRTDLFKDVIPFVEIQLIRHDLQAYMSAAVLIRSLRFLPHFSQLIGNLLEVFYKSIRNSIGFLLLFFLIFMSFVFFATFHYGNELYEFHTFALTSYTLIRCTLGQFEYDRAYRVSPVWTPIFYMLYVCVIFFILLNLFVAIVNEAYVLGKQEQQQIENDLHEEYLHRTTTEGLNAFRRTRRPVLQAAVIRWINPLLQLVFRHSFDVDQETSSLTESEDEEISLEEKQTIVVKKLRELLLREGLKKNVIDKFIDRLPMNDDEEDALLFRMDEEKILRILRDEFLIFNKQFEKLAEDWRRAALNTREMTLVETIDIAQASLVKEHLTVLDRAIEQLEPLIRRALENLLELYNHS